MSWLVFITQVALPVTLLVWLAFFPATGVLARVVQWLSVGAILLGIGLAALWTVPPFWVPYLYYGLFAIILTWHVSKRRIVGNGLWREGTGATTIIILVLGLGIVGIYLAYSAYQGRALPAAETVNIAPPFGPGTYLVAHGGSTEMVNIHLQTLDPATERFRAWRGQSRALDIFRISPSGWHKNGWQPADPRRYYTFGTPVLAPCVGTVERVVRGNNDMQVPRMDRDHMAGNFVAINCGDFFVILAHLRQGSIKVHVGDTVQSGRQVGEMGNSGNSSEPHLHVHAQKTLPAHADLAGEPLALKINGVFHVRNDRITVSDNTVE